MHIQNIRKERDNCENSLYTYLDSFFSQILKFDKAIEPRELGQKNHCVLRRLFITQQALKPRKSDRKIYSIYKDIFNAQQGINPQAVLTLLNYLEQVMDFANKLSPKNNYNDSFLIATNLTEANLTDTNLRGANLIATNFKGAHLGWADLEKADLEKADLDKARLGTTNLEKANLRGANLTEADLTQANLRGANLTEANLRGTHLRGADLTGANIEAASFSNKAAFKVLEDKTLSLNIKVDNVFYERNLKTAISYLDLLLARINDLDEKTLGYIAKNIFDQDEIDLGNFPLEPAYKELINNNKNQPVPFIKTLRSALAAKFMVDQLSEEFSLPEKKEEFKRYLQDSLIPKDTEQKKTFIHRLNATSMYDLANILDGIRPIICYILLPELYEKEGQKFCQNLSPGQLDKILKQQSPSLIKLLQQVHQERAQQIDLAILLKWSKDIHDPRCNFNRMLTQYLPASDWQALIMEPVLINKDDIYIKNLCSFEEFQKISNITGLCIGKDATYSTMAEAGQRHYFAVYKGETPHSVLEFEIDEIDQQRSLAFENYVPIFIKTNGDKEAHYSGKVLKLIQHEGWVSDGREPSKIAQESYEIFKAKLANGEIDVNLNAHNYGKIKATEQAVVTNSAFEKALACSFNSALNKNSEIQEPIAYISKLAFDIFSANTSRTITTEIDGAPQQINIPNIWNNGKPRIPVLPKNIDYNTWTKKLQTLH